ncbi:MAG: alpha-amylase family glycosyl hydrolase [Planctomycetota bacterium]
MPSLAERLNVIYGARADEALAEIESATAEVTAALAAQSLPPTPRWTERDVVLITYADQLRAGGDDDRSPLATLTNWLRREGFDDLVSTVHLLPFCPYSSDDGFSVIDYLAVDPASGTWADIAVLSERFGLMFDLVLNHMSDQSEWFAAYTRGEAPFDNFFIEVDPGADLSAVTRPRPGPPWKEVPTASGVRRVWSTFSDGATKDQMDLNYAEPRVLAEMLRVLLEYAYRGARIIRLDAIAYLWKELGTNCIHLPQTHEVVKLCRDLLAMHSPRTLVLTETNVPHAENVSYFGQVATGDGDQAGGVSEAGGPAEADEAHMIYNFSLPPLLLDAFVSGDATAIRAWLKDLAPPPPGCTFFNFTASHDGVGVRPLEGLVAPERLARLVEAMRARGGKVNMKRNPDGSESPYELNITYVDALTPDPVGDGEPDTALHARRFLASQAVMLALRGMPAPYFHSLVGTRNDYAGMEQSGQNRRINRHKYTLPELDAHLAAPPSNDQQTLQRLIYDGYRKLLALRIAQPAFHPDAPHEVIDTGNEKVLAFKRTSLDGQQTILVAVNFSNENESINTLPDAGVNLVTGEAVHASPIEVSAGGFLYANLNASR